LVHKEYEVLLDPDLKVLLALAVQLEILVILVLKEYEVLLDLVLKALVDLLVL
jgi:hypothetical protein